MVKDFVKPQSSDLYAPLAPLQRLRSYSRRKDDGTRETWDETCDRVFYSPHLGLKILGKFTDEEIELIDRMQRKKKAFGSARALWVQGTEWFADPDHYPSTFNCSSFKIVDWNSFGILMDLAMMGCGTGATVELEFINQLPAIVNKLNIELIGEPGDIEPHLRIQQTSIEINEARNAVRINVGDSRQGWVEAYQSLLEIASDLGLQNELTVFVDNRHVRPKGEPLKRFGGVANPIALPALFNKVAKVLNNACGRKLNSLECCLIINEAALVVVSGNLRRSANIQQGSSEDQYFTTAKDDLWQVDDRGNWRVDPDRDALRMANLTRVYHHKPTLKECVSAVQKQFFSGEGAIQWAGESVARCNADLLDTPSKKQEFLNLYAQDRNLAKDYLSSIQPNHVDIRELNHRMDRYQGNPCFEIHSTEFFCNLSSVHLNQIDPFDLNEQANAFTASALQVAAYLQRGFTNPRYQYSRDLDPIVGVSFTGAFTFFVKAFGTDWLKWWQSGRPEEWNPYDLSLNNIAIQNAIRIGEKLDIFYHPAYATLGEFWKKAEKECLNFWRSTVEETIKEYCDRHNLKCPNRSTTLKPEGSLTLLTGVGACGWHPPKAKHYIRRMTFGAYDPIALAAVDYGYSIVPSQSCKDENGRLLDDPFDPRVTEWLVEVPVEEPWANLPGVEDIDPSAFPIEAQWDFYMMCQKHYVRHNGSATLEIYEDEVETLAKLIYNSIQNDEGYISAAILGRSKGNLSFPRLPFEPVSKEKYDELVQGVLDRRISDDFMELIAKHDNHESLQPQDSACDGGACLLK